LIDGKKPDLLEVIVGVAGAILVQVEARPQLRIHSRVRCTEHRTFALVEPAAAATAFDHGGSESIRPRFGQDSIER
jgi:hypothetical protein